MSSTFSSEARASRARMASAIFSGSDRSRMANGLNLRQRSMPAPGRVAPGPTDLELGGRGFETHLERLTAGPVVARRGDRLPKLPTRSHDEPLAAPAPGPGPGTAVEIGP